MLDFTQKKKNKSSKNSKNNIIFFILTNSWNSRPTKKIVRGADVPVLTSLAGLNPRSKHALLGLLALLAALRAGNKPERQVIKNIKKKKKEVRRNADNLHDKY